MSPTLNWTCTWSLRVGVTSLPARTRTLEPVMAPFWPSALTNFLATRLKLPGGGTMTAQPFSSPITCTVAGLRG